jgi:hypothetical protein
MFVFVQNSGGLTITIGLAIVSQGQQLDFFDSLSQGIGLEAGFVMSSRRTSST